MKRADFDADRATMIIGKIGETFCVIHRGDKAVVMINGGFIDGSRRAITDAAAAQMAIV